MPRLLLIDNYDSFTYNLVQYLSELGAEVKVARNDELTVANVEKMSPRAIVLSPGPGRPQQAGIMNELIKTMAGRVPILGVCLGHQAIGQAFGGRIVHARAVMHGKTSPVLHAGAGVFQGLPSPLTATRYHSLIAERDSLPDCLEITAWLEDGTIMGLRHRDHPHLQGVQFHPESILTGCGHDLLRNFLARV